MTHQRAYKGSLLSLTQSPTCDCGTERLRGSSFTLPLEWMITHDYLIHYLQFATCAATPMALLRSSYVRA